MTNKPSRVRQRIISSVIALLMIAGAVYYSGILKASKKEPQQKNKSQITNVIYAPVSLKDASVFIQSNGVLVAKNQIDIVSRAQGIFKRSDHAFRAGVYFKKDEVLVEIDSDEYVANLRASKAQLLQSLSAVLADLKFDYGDSFDKWNTYVQNFKVDGILAPLPVMSSDRERAFINTKSIVAEYYNIKAQEVQQSYYQIRAPFSGILKENFVNQGAMITPGQTLGTLIDPSVYELELKISPSELKLIKIGKQVSLSQNDGTGDYKGTIKRINSVIDPQSQSALAVVELRGKGLREGMFLQADISTVQLKDVAEISRSLLVEENHVFVVADSTLKKVNIDVLHIGEKSVFVKGLQEGDWVVQKSVAGAYDGMKVNPLNLSE